LRVEGHIRKGRKKVCRSTQVVLRKLKGEPVRGERREFSCLEATDRKTHDGKRRRDLFVQAPGKCCRRASRVKKRSPTNGFKRLYVRKKSGFAPEKSEGSGEVKGGYGKKENETCRFWHWQRGGHVEPMICKKRSPIKKKKMREEERGRDGGKGGKKMGFQQRAMPF